MEVGGDAELGLPRRSRLDAWIAERPILPYDAEVARAWAGSPRLLSYEGVPVLRTTPGSLRAASATGCRFSPSTSATSSTSGTTTGCSSQRASPTTWRSATTWRTATTGVALFPTSAHSPPNQSGAHFDLPRLPLVVGLTAYGKCIGLTRYREVPRITVASGVFSSTRMVDDVLVHETLHASLILAGANPDHDSADWCRSIVTLSPAIAGESVLAVPDKVIKVPNGAGGRKSAQVHPRGAPRGPRAGARWPHCLRPDGYYEAAPGVAVDTY